MGRTKNDFMEEREKQTPREVYEDMLINGSTPTIDDLNNLFEWDVTDENTKEDDKPNN